MKEKYKIKHKSVFVKRGMVFLMAAAIFMVQRVVQNAAQMEQISEKKNIRIIAEKTGNVIDTFQIHYSGTGIFKIMQVTDVHISGVPENEGKNKKAMQTVYEMTVREQPDFIVITGDFIFGMPYSDSEQDLKSLKEALTFMDQIGIPWTWCFGNHDHDFLDRLETEEIQALLQNCDTLYMPENNTAVKGYSNAVFKVYNNNKLISAFITMDTHNGIYDSENNLICYDYMDQTQINWYRQHIESLKEEGGVELSTFVYLHIPLEEYAEDNEILSGKLREEVCCSNVHNDFIETVQELKSTKAVFCGHDHLNDAIMRYGDLLLVYAKSIDYTAYIGIEDQHEQRGVGELLIFEDGSFDICNIQYERRK